MNYYFAHRKNRHDKNITELSVLLGNCFVFFEEKATFMREFRKKDVGTLLTWSLVSEIHKVRNGIYQRNGKLISLLTDFGEINACYPDFTGETANTIFYTGAGRRGDQKMDVYNQALHNAINTRTSVPLFCKLEVNQWKFMGFWQVIDAEYIFDGKQKRNVWSFTLKQVETE